MKIYFEETNGANNVIITDGQTAKIFDGAPSGVYEGVDLYADGAAEKLKERFAEISETGMNDYNDIYSANEISFSDVAPELENSILIYEC